MGAAVNGVLWPRARRSTTVGSTDLEVAPRSKLGPAGPIDSVLGDEARRLEYPPLQPWAE